MPHMAQDIEMITIPMQQQSVLLGRSLCVDRQFSVFVIAVAVTVSVALVVTVFVALAVTVYATLAIALTTVVVVALATTVVVALAAASSVVVAMESSVVVVVALAATVVVALTIASLVAVAMESSVTEVSFMVLEKLVVVGIRDQPVVFVTHRSSTSRTSKKIPILRKFMKVLRLLSKLDTPPEPVKKKASSGSLNRGMSTSNSGSGKTRRGRGVTRLADVTTGRVDGQRRHVDIDPRSGHPSGPNADRFRSYLGKLAKSHVSILHACWDDVLEVDKNLLWQDIQQHYDIPNTIQIRKKVLSHIAIRWMDFKTRLTRLYVFGDRQHENPSQQYTFTEEDWMQFRASRESEEWKKLRKSRADALGLESPDLAPAPARYEDWKAARTKSDGNMTSSSAALISQRIFTCPQKQPIHDTVIHEDDDMAEAEDDPLSKLMTTLPRLKKASSELYWDLRVFGLPPHVPVYITFSDALEVIGGDRMLNISIIQLWCMYMDTIVVDQGQSSMYGFVEPQTIQLSGNTLQNRQHYLQTWMDESKRDVYLVPYIDGLHWQLMVIIPKACKIIWFCSLYRKMKNDLRTMLQGVIGKSRGQLVQILYPKVTIIRAVITDDWNECTNRRPTPPLPQNHSGIGGYTSDVCIDDGGGDVERLCGRQRGAHWTSIWTSEGVHTGRLERRRG
ncbi:uncharacterized protein HKW66_Vig0001040 [Vigna angularis]|uniref:Ubiquitin-like protease family profile domain-containing protein n=1 Tax=Phaseolus angularis TaxID=3914 RepID=A0A8T0LBB8_PHAAN|nr:uncharacterized protein HKW66_Vig0001040 [Vigna angularis]